MYIPPACLTDAYKPSHRLMSPKGTQRIYSNFTPRFDHYFRAKYKTYDGGIVWFGLRGALTKILHEFWDDCFFKQPKNEAIKAIRDIFEPYMGLTDMSNFEALHDLGYLPLHIKSLDEGSISKIGIPTMTITNTHDDFQWLPNYFESALSTELWKPMTVATIARTMRLLINKFAMETDGNLDNTDYQLHDFSFRGQSGIENSAALGAAFLLFSKGTDNIPAIPYIGHYYDTKYGGNFNIANSVPAGEHSVTTLGIQLAAQKAKKEYLLFDKSALHVGEIDYIRYVIEQFKDGILSYVADSYDYFNVLDNILPHPSVYDDIMNRDGKFVIRGDSGDPVEIIAGIKYTDYSEQATIVVAASRAFYDNLEMADNGIISDKNKGNVETIFSYNGLIYKSVYFVELDSYKRFSNATFVSVDEYTLTTPERGTVERLWDIFGGTINEMGYKVLDSHIGVIYGDGINEERANEIMTRLRDKGFSSTSVVFGIGSYTLNMLSRDDLGTAIKATSAVVDGERLSIYKDPKTDSSKKSAKGLLRVDIIDGDYVLTDDVSEISEQGGELKSVWLDGKFVKTDSFETIYNRIER